MDTGFYRKVKTALYHATRSWLVYVDLFTMEVVTDVYIDGVNRPPWEPTTFIFRGYNPYFGGVKPSVFMVWGSKGNNYNNKLPFF